jgi:diguanylate cyclase (GGDEF)-like protein
MEATNSLFTIDSINLESGEVHYRFSPITWNYFERSHILERMVTWMSIASECWTLRHIVSWTDSEFNVEIVMSPLPEGFISLSEIQSNHALNDAQKARVTANICHALGMLHSRQFYVGFLSADMVSVHPETLEIILDLQPFPSAYPFINFNLTDYPFIIFSSYCRTHTITRASDFYAAGILMYYLFQGELPEHTYSRGHREFQLGELNTLYSRMVDKPQYLFIEEAADDICRIFRLEPKPWEPIVGDNLNAWLFPAEPPIHADSQRLFREFLRSEGSNRIAILHEDESLIAGVLRVHMNEVLESQSFITVKCSDLPFSTMLEMVNRIIDGLISTHAPEAEPQFHALSRHHRQLIQQYYCGEDVFQAFGDLILRIYHELIVNVAIGNVYIILEDCDNMDQESQRLFAYLWNSYREQMPRLYIVLCGKMLPDLAPIDHPDKIEFLNKIPSSYINLMQTQLCRIDLDIIHSLGEWLAQKQIDPKYTTLMLEAFIDQGLLKLTSAGWIRGERDTPLESTNPYLIIATKLKTLTEEDSQFLALLCCLPSPIRAWNLYKVNGLDFERLLSSLHRLAKLGIILLFHQNSIFVPNEIREMLFQQCSESYLEEIYSMATELLFTLQKDPSPTLLELVKKSGNKRREYLFLMLYLRKNRKAFSSRQTRTVLEKLIELHEQLDRPKLKCFYRMILPVYSGFGELKQCEEVCLRLYELSNREGDRFKWMFFRMQQNQLELSEHKADLLAFIEEKNHRFSDKLDAMRLLIANRIYVNLEPCEKDFIKDFYIEQIYPNRHLIPQWEFVYSSLYYAGFIFESYPQLNEWGIALLNKLESMLHYTFYPDLILRVYNTYIHQNNTRMARNYIEKVIGGAVQLGHPSLLEVGHANGMEVSITLGDVTAFHHHWKQVGDVKRKDLVEGIRDMVRLFACEWRDWDLLERLSKEQDTTEYNKTRMELYRIYSSYRKAETLSSPMLIIQEEQPALFIDALMCIQAGDKVKACQLFQQCIEVATERKVRFPILEGWAFREMLLIMLGAQVDTAGDDPGMQRASHEELEKWLNRFKQFIEGDANELFWPDYFYISAIWAMHENDKTNGLLLLRRAINGYHLVHKEDRAEEVEREMEAFMVPAGLPVSWELAEDRHVLQIIQERKEYLAQSLNYLTTIRLFDYLPNSLDLNRTIDRVIFALFEYYPIAYVSITFDLTFKESKDYYSAFGLINKDVLHEYRSKKHLLHKYNFVLFQDCHQSIQMKIYLMNANAYENINNQLDQLLYMIKPHIANAVLYEEIMIDSLTGLYLRKYFMDRLNQEFELSKKFGLDLSVLMIDLDNFRKVNEHGHQEGDAVLQKIADTIRTMLSLQDIPGRFGGEEFLIILPKTDGKHALKMASEIRKQIELEFGGSNQPYHVTASVGVASMELCHAKTPEDLIRLADEAEIWAKKTGKNKVVAAWMNQLRREDLT